VITPAKCRFFHRAKFKQLLDYLYDHRFSRQAPTGRNNYLRAYFAGYHNGLDGRIALSAAAELTVATKEKRQVIDITGLVEKNLEKSAAAVSVFVAHTTCAITTADLDPGTDLDLLDAVWEMIPKLEYRHPHDPSHVPAHLASSVIGPDVTVPVKNGKLVMGTWQRIILVELDGPRDRKIITTFF
jgi:secondary thiamine-phosphate synthase enzyme